jgi:hypothetical protein
MRVMRLKLNIFQHHSFRLFKQTKLAVALVCQHEAYVMRVKKNMILHSCSCLILVNLGEYWQLLCFLNNVFNYIYTCVRIDAYRCV